MPSGMLPTVMCPVVLHDYGGEVRGGEELAGHVAPLQVYGLVLMWIGVEVGRSMWFGERCSSQRLGGGGGGSGCCARCIMVALPERQLLEL